MKAIHADPKEVRKLFNDSYSIPDFQRPYSWDVEQCEKLWEDITDFLAQKSGPEDRYFLGNLVIYPAAKDFSVIDGQQRLTTLLLLIKALHLKAGTVVALERCLRKEDPLTSTLTNEMRVNSNVVENDSASLHEIIFNNGNELKPGRFKSNFEFFNEAIGKWWHQKGQTAERLHELILTILDRVVLLPIHCSSEDDALTIFETINNRGMALTDADIFKAKLYGVSPSKEKFIEKWQELEGHEWLFRIHMHTMRAKHADTSKEVGLRSYFSNRTRLQLDSEYVMDSIKLYQSVWSWESNTTISILWAILDSYPNYYWQFPLYAFLRRHGVTDSSGAFSLALEKIAEFESLIQELFRFVYVKGIVHNSVNAIRDTISKANSLIWSGGDYISEFRNSYSTDLTEALRRFEQGDYGRYQRGFILLSSLLNPKQDRKQFLEVIQNKFHVEHILPKKWNDYDGWTADSWKKWIDRIGNLVPLEWKLNISAKNEYFPRKKDKYKLSKMEGVQELCLLNEWTEAQVAKREEVITKQFQDFFGGKLSL
jgi:hypothetical protein